MRGAAHAQKSVIFLYSSKANAEESREEGASGCIFGVTSKVFPNLAYQYAVTNRHVIEHGASVIRVNSRDGGVDVLDLKPSDWILSPTDDLAICDAPFDFEKHDIESVSTDNFLTTSDVEKYQMGPGMEVFVVGRFVAHSGKRRNQPAARFGVVSMLDSEPVRQSSGNLQESVLVEMHSISGYSGSPVYIYLSKQTPGTSLTMGWDYKTWFLGIDWGHLPKWEFVVDEYGDRHPDGWRVKLNSGMMGVVPCWKLLDLINCEELMEKREKQERMFREQKESAGTLDTATVTTVEKKEFTQADFESALRKVSRKIQPVKPE